jgi:hypothetical protein
MYQVEKVKSNTDIVCVCLMYQVYIQILKNFKCPVELSNHSYNTSSKDKMSRSDGIMVVMVFIQKEPGVLSVPFWCFYKQVKNLVQILS